MPKYEWSGETTTKFGKYVFKAGEKKETDEYFTDVNLGLLSHLPAVSNQPVEIFFDGDITSGEISRVIVDQKYSKIDVYNNSGADIRVSSNDTSGEYTIVPDNVIATLDNQLNNIGIIDLIGSGSNQVAVSGKF